jgi:transcriptional regulator with GAF, ATPase, and Fis domain
MPISAENISAQASGLTRRLMSALAVGASRRLFFSSLARLLREYFPFDRLCINLYDQQGGMLTYFTAAEGTVVRTLSPVRPADLSSTVAGHVIAERKPVIITDFADYFPESALHPIAEAGLTATMAFPLMLDNEIIATLHCSFAEKPENFYEITSFLLELAPVVATCVGAVFALEHLRRNGSEFQTPSVFALSSDDAVICHSRVMREIMRRVDDAAKLNIPVLLLGETGTGKSLLAQIIHRRSPRKDARFVKVNCPSLPQALFESELFGHVKGAFTGAAQKRVGRFELAHEGTLFLDEIGELTPEMQSKLLQVVEDANFERVGESVPLAVDVRVIAATNINVGEALAAGKLRGDLFYRLASCAVELPPLRERPEDIPPLAAAFVAQVSAKLGLPPIRLTAAHMSPLRDHSWPGNVRELRNVITRAVMKAATEKQLGAVAIESLLEENRRFTAPRAGSAPAAPAKEAPEAPPQASPGMRSLAEMEHEHILRALERTGGVISGPGGAAALLGIPRSTLQHRMRKLGIP